MGAQGAVLRVPNFHFSEGPHVRGVGPLLIKEGPTLHTFVAHAWRRYALQQNIVAKVLVASQDILLQTYVAEWPPSLLQTPCF